MTQNRLPLRVNGTKDDAPLHFLRRPTLMVLPKCESKV